jgi:dihydrofolate reductase
MAIIGIVAISKNYAIGKDGKLPWHYSADLKFFKETTTGNAVVMGANTWRSIGRPLPNRLNIILTRSGKIDPPPDVLMFSESSKVLQLSKSVDCDFYIIGGAKTYEAFADVIEKWLVTCVPEYIDDADTSMPADFLDDFELEETIGLDGDLTVRIMRRK